ncbi:MULTISPECIES: hypothetical protein [unclassified Pseudomonas]|uniref:hypothetical protein n=1 Tax=unclassified Pseudomonas TaxID=196821 RepID=UPI0023B9394B|nr:MULTISPECIES: hypothetical protein [unclassified Pseudomonas]
MQIIRIALIACLLAGCAANLDYRAQPLSEAQAYEAIHTAALQQKEITHPDALYLDSRYLGFREQGEASTPSDIGERIYFNSLGPVVLYQQRDDYLVRLQHLDGTTLRTFRLAEREQAERLVDALIHYRENAPQFSGLK